MILLLRERHFRISANGTPSGRDSKVVQREAHEDVGALLDELERLRDERDDESPA